MSQRASMIIVTEPKEKSLRTASFIVHVTRGLIRDQKMRRNAMFVLVVVALVLLFSGSTFLQSALNPRQHPIWFISFWLVCGWVTLTALLLAVFDLLMVKLDARKTEKTLREKFAQSETRDSPGSTIEK